METTVHNQCWSEDSRLEGPTGVNTYWRAEGVQLRGLLDNGDVGTLVSPVSTDATRNTANTTQRAWQQRTIRRASSKVTQLEPVAMAPVTLPASKFSTWAVANQTESQGAQQAWDTAALPKEFHHSATERPTSRKTCEVLPFSQGSSLMLTSRRRSSRPILDTQEGTPGSTAAESTRTSARNLYDCSSARSSARSSFERAQVAAANIPGLAVDEKQNQEQLDIQIIVSNPVPAGSRSNKTPRTQLFVKPATEQKESHAATSNTASAGNTVFGKYSTLDKNVLFDIVTALFKMNSSKSSPTTNPCTPVAALDALPAKHPQQSLHRSRWFRSNKVAACLPRTASTTSPTSPLNSVAPNPLFCMSAHSEHDSTDAVNAVQSLNHSDSLATDRSSDAALRSSVLSSLRSSFRSDSCTETPSGVVNGHKQQSAVERSSPAFSQRGSLTSYQRSSSLPATCTTIITLKQCHGNNFDGWVTVLPRCRFFPSGASVAPIDEHDVLVPKVGTEVLKIATPAKTKTTSLFGKPKRVLSAK